MKSLFYTIVLLFVTKVTVAQEQLGINFLQGKTWANAIAQAKTENKLIFVDVYTDWCGPCKVMDAEVFSKKSVGDMFNNSFINYKLDAEKGEGPMLAKKYVVKSYPNYLFIDSDGILIYRSTSSMPIADFLNVGKNALLEAKQEQTIVHLDLLYPSMKKDKTFMYNYVSRRTVLRIDNADLLDEYITLLNDTERGEIKNLQLILDNGMFLAKNLQLGISLTTLKKHKDKFPLLKQTYKEGIEGIENTAIATTLKKAIAKKNEKILNQVIALKKPSKISTFDNKEIALLTYYLGINDKAKYLTAAKAYLTDFLLKISLDTLAKQDKQTFESQLKYIKEKKDFKGNAEEEAQDYKRAVTIQLTNVINTIAKNFANLATSTSDLKAALSWSDYSLKITAVDLEYYQNVIPFYKETNIILLYKTGNKKLALYKLEELMSSFGKNQRALAHFEPLLKKLKANEKL